MKNHSADVFWISLQHGDQSTTSLKNKGLFSCNKKACLHKSLDFFFLRIKTFRSLLYLCGTVVVEVNFLLRPQERIWKLHDQFCTCLPIAPHSLPVDSRDCGRIRSPKIRIKRSILKGTNINSGPGKNSS